MESLRFTGSGSEYFKIWIVNVLLTIVTLGIYYPWAKVRNRRYFYANSTLSDRNFEYHATGKQLFLGFVIGVTLFVIYSFVTRIAPQFAGIFMLLFMLVLPWLVWRSLMFNMKVTSFSNVHFSFKGNLKRAYVIFLGYPALVFLFLAIIGVAASVLIPNLEHLKSSVGNTDNTILTIGAIVFGTLVLLGYLFFISFITKNIKEYFIGNSCYGQGTFQTNIETKILFIILLKSVGILAVVGILAFLATKMGINAELIVIIAYIVAVFAMMAFYVTRERAYLYENTTLDNKIAFESTLKSKDLAWVMLSNIFLILITVGLGFPWARVRMARLMLKNTLVDTSLGFDEYISKKQDDQSALGEQIGEAFDVDVGIAF